MRRVKQDERHPDVVVRESDGKYFCNCAYPEEAAKIVQALNILADPENEGTLDLIVKISHWNGDWTAEIMAPSDAKFNLVEVEDDKLTPGDSDCAAAAYLLLNDEGVRTRINELAAEAAKG